MKSHQLKDNQDNQKNTQTRPKRTIAEWVTFSIALAILSVIVGLVIYIWKQEQAQQEIPKIFVSQEGQVQRQSGQYYVPFSVTNHGGITAESVQIVAELDVNGKVESGEQQVDFLSSKEKEEGVFIFQQNPQQGKLTIRVASYKLP